MIINWYCSHEIGEYGSFNIEAFFKYFYCLDFYNTKKF